jgi:N-acetylglucosamine malate deacetylase 1
MKSKILILAPHTDDGELGCGGSISRFLKEGKEIYYAAFSAPKLYKKGFEKDALKHEFKNACSVLGLKSKNIFLFDFEVRVFDSKRQEILDKIISLRDKINPDIVFTPSKFDVHQDHIVIYKETIRAFKANKSSILGYEMPWNNMSFNTDLYIHIDEEDIDKKIKLLRQYKSQKHREYVTKEFIRSLAKVRGVEINVPFAECFQVIKWVI